MPGTENYDIDQNTPQYEDASQFFESWLTDPAFMDGAKGSPYPIIEPRLAATYHLSPEEAADVALHAFETKLANVIDRQ